MRNVIRFSIAFIVGLTACGIMDTIPPDTPVDGEVCKAACDNRYRLNCIETALIDVCVPVCQKTSAAGLYAPNCVARATTKFEMAKCNVKCEP